MIRINNIKMDITYSSKELEQTIMKKLRLKSVPEYKLAKLSIDNREKNNVKYVIAVDVKLKSEKDILKRINDKNIMLTNAEKYHFPIVGNEEMANPPIIIGTGPAGLFAGLWLARMGYKPILFERGQDVDTRTKTISDFWEGNSPLSPESNVQFGEGGAGTFSDGKLNSVVKDKSGRRSAVFKTFVEYGADESILYINKPHIGTDKLVDIVKNIRNEIIKLGGSVYFQSKFVDCKMIDDTTTEVYIEHMGQNTSYTTNALVLAIGHSARDTYEMLYDRGLPMVRKPFAMGVRVEHPRQMINKCQYGDRADYEKLLPTADYKLTHQCSNGRAVYSFCMCPGGYVVNASSEEGRICVNGMSYSDRMADNSNSAIVVNVTPEDYETVANEDSLNRPALAGMYFQRYYEEKAYKAGNGKVPVQRFEDFKVGKATTEAGHIKPAIKGAYAFADLNGCLPEYIKDAIIEGVDSFDRYLPGYADDDTLFSGIEARTSSPVRIERNEEYICENTCIYPCGEGGGYAGGITSAAVDGIKVAEAIIGKYRPIY